MFQYLREDSKCPTAEVELERVNNSPEVRRVHEENKDLLEYVNHHSGTDTDDVVLMGLIMHDTLLIEVSFLLMYFFMQFLNCFVRFVFQVNEKLHFAEVDGSSVPGQAEFACCVLLFDVFVVADFEEISWRTTCSSDGGEYDEENWQS